MGIAYFFENKTVALLVQYLFKVFHFILSHRDITDITHCKTVPTLPTNLRIAYTFYKINIMWGIKIQRKRSLAKKFGKTY